MCHKKAIKLETSIADTMQRNDQIPPSQIKEISLNTWGN